MTIEIKRSIAYLCVPISNLYLYLTLLSLGAKYGAPDVITHISKHHSDSGRLDRCTRMDRNYKKVLKSQVYT
ncbi:hypothetical protein RRG08_002435 [Elysia crispata]|uniref:Uncharacterized protein n=1 Tax=Elysia crispata TaxID=231223 RepID=A0AAE1A7P6_9GAST|nr:hypothetical protein RRG08_002435 [Elysia crispata]